MPRRSTLVAAVALILMGCGSGQDEPSQAKPAIAAAAAEPAAPSGPTVTLTGKVVLQGAAPARKTIKMSADPYCAKQHTAPVLSEDIVADANGMLQNVFVYVKTGLEGRKYPTPEAAAVLDQKGCMYVPHVLGLMVNQKLQIMNSDATLHNVHAMPKVGEFNVGMPRQNTSIERKFAQPEVMVHFKCDVHPWMSAWMGVLPHPCFGVSDASGAYSIPSLPPGTYTIEAWHEKLGTQTQQITVTAGQTPKLDFTFKAPGS